MNDGVLELGVSEFVELLNQTLDFAYPNVSIIGELANLRVSKNRWVYFDLKDDEAIVKFFGTVYQLPGPLEDGMMLKVKGQPRLHPLYGFSVNVQSIQPSGEGTIKKAAVLLQAKLAAEGLFAIERKRALPYPPERIGLITSAQSAAYADFTKILNDRWRGLEIDHIDVQVQGEAAPIQIVRAIEQINALSKPPQVLVIIRGGGSAEDLAAFSTEIVTRAIAASRVPTLVAIGHEIDLSLAELAADQQASTPSNAAELLVPDRKQTLTQLKNLAVTLQSNGVNRIGRALSDLSIQNIELNRLIQNPINLAIDNNQSQLKLLTALSPSSVLNRGYAIVRSETGQLLRSAKQVKTDDKVTIQLASGRLGATVNKTKMG